MSVSRLPWTALGELQKLQNGQYLDISTDIPGDEEVPWKYLLGRGGGRL